MAKSEALAPEAPPSAKELAPNLAPVEDGWERVEVGLGDKIDWAQTKEFHGIYRGRTTITPEGGEPCDAHQFVDMNGEEFFAWATYELDIALEGKEGIECKITHLSKKELDGGRTVNHFRVLTKKVS